MVHLIFSVAQISICHWRWVLMPPEVLPDAFLCDESCSKGKEDDINVLSWYTHVLPQIRHRWSSSKMSNWHQQCWSPHTCFPTAPSAWTLKPPGNKFHWIVLKEVLWKQGEGVCAGSRRDNIHAGIYRSKLDFYLKAIFRDTWPMLWWILTKTFQSLKTFSCQTVSRTGFMGELRSHWKICSKPSSKPGWWLERISSALKTTVQELGRRKGFGSRCTSGEN